ncbi:carbohydrate-binding domain-containing protein [Paenibacillus hodogayensis]|uniref:Carbohydrate-binding domain-containing protein n=1 Tax=Paenibacillus hodogayensis TaxID=279208 RepID=A0ABV5W2B0_9BACL
MTEQVSAQSGGEIQLTEKPGAQPAGSLNSFSHWDAVGHTLSWYLSLEAPGQYAVMFRYAAALDQSRRTFRMDGLEAVKVVFPKTDGWNEWKEGWIRLVRVGAQ